MTPSALLRSVPANVSADLAAACSRASDLPPRAFAVDDGAARTAAARRSSSLRALGSFRAMADALSSVAPPRLDGPPVSVEGDAVSLAVGRACTPATATRVGPTELRASARVRGQGWEASATDDPRHDVWRTRCDGVSVDGCDGKSVDARLGAAESSARARVLRGEDGPSIESWAWTLRLAGRAVVRCEERPADATVTVLASPACTAEDLATAAAVVAAGDFRRPVRAAFEEALASGRRRTPSEVPEIGWGAVVRARAREGFTSARRVGPSTTPFADRVSVFDRARFDRARSDAVEAFGPLARDSSTDPFDYHGEGPMAGFLGTTVSALSDRIGTSRLDLALARVTDSGLEATLVGVGVHLSAVPDEEWRDWDFAWRNGVRTFVGGETRDPCEWAERELVPAYDSRVLFAARAVSCVDEYESVRWWTDS